jgi:hypothetical protein
VRRTGQDRKRSSVMRLDWSMMLAYAWAAFTLSRTAPARKHRPAIVQHHADLASPISLGRSAWRGCLRLLERGHRGIDAAWTLASSRHRIRTLTREAFSCCTAAPKHYCSCIGRRIPRAHCSGAIVKSLPACTSHGSGGAGKRRSCCGARVDDHLARHAVPRQCSVCARRGGGGDSARRCARNRGAD